MSDFKDIAHKTVAELFDMLKEKQYTVDALSEISHEKDLEIADLKAQLNNMEACYIEKKKQAEELQARANKALSVTGNYCDEDDAALLVFVLEKALRGES
ncbi:hypothetical protein F891_01901 [Acinetobacter sp. CIP 101966]|uniref:hypothetical protein n=1 Tax=Acinetobacter sp. CIP 101966 TaxID=1144662 RepID=UPI0002CD8C3B|nr:hypothetical protein [Acinetobacter sp. CIP 101966]ENX26948.1 hypothetical protein F891_01901 [Acinetobacter sp. CIP 101966]